MNTSLKDSDTSRHAAVAAEKAIEFVERRLPEIQDLLSIDRANNAIREARESIIAVDRAISNVLRASQALDEARSSLSEAKRLARKASEKAYGSTPVILSDILNPHDLSVGYKVLVQTRYLTRVGEGIITQINDDFVWVDQEIYSIEDHIFSITP